MVLRQAIRLPDSGVKDEGRESPWSSETDVVQESPGMAAPFAASIRGRVNAATF